MAVSKAETGYGCPKCGARANVKDSRRTDEGNVRRSRLCSSCAHRFHTVESQALVTTTERQRLITKILFHIEDLTNLADLLNAEHD